MAAIEEDGEQQGTAISPGRTMDRRAINPGDERSLTVTSGHPAEQVRPRNSADRADSQADRSITD
jgi:hypothetical protein